MNPIPCKDRPKDCKCDPKSWAEYYYYKICSQYVRDKGFGDGRCQNCDHEKACHSKSFLGIIQPRDKSKKTHVY